ncbi:MAG: YlxR family protein [Solirubrobacteraceae bacterium]
MGCRRTQDKAQLLRLVAVAGALTADPAMRLPGRGAYVHRDRGCWEAALSRRAFARALRRDVAVPSQRPF